MVKIQIPSNFEGGLLGYLLSFSRVFTRQQEVKYCLDSVEDNIRQARLLIGEPIGLFACLTAEEEAARFFYLCLKKRAYDLPRYNSLTAHQDKARILIWATVIEEYFFNFFNSIGSEFQLSVQSVERGVRISGHTKVNENYWIELPNVLQMIATSGKGDGLEKQNAEAAMVRACFDRTMSSNFGANIRPEKVVEYIARRRNRCLYGDPKKKQRLKNMDELDQFEKNCAALMVMGFLVMQDNKRWPSMQIICTELGRVLAHTPRKQKKQGGI